MNWQTFNVASDGTHHIMHNGSPAYSARFDSVLKFHSPGLAPVLCDGLAWHIYPDGSAAYKQRFLKVFGFYGNRAAIITSNGWSHITPDGQYAYVSRYAWCGNFQENYCTVRESDNDYHHITPDGNPVYSEHWHYAGDYRDGIAVVQANDGYSTHINSSGHLLHGCWFTDLDVFHKGFARARDAGGWMHVNLRGIPVYARRFLAIEPFYNGQARVECFDGTLEVINEIGETLIILRSSFESMNLSIKKGKSK